MGLWVWGGKKNLTGKTRSREKFRFFIILHWGREVVFSKKTCFLSRSSHFYIRCNDLIFKIYEVWVRQWLYESCLGRLVSGAQDNSLCSSLFLSLSLFSQALHMPEYKLPCRTFCLWNEPRIGILALGILDSPAEVPFTVMSTFHWQRVRKAIVVRDVSFWCLSGLN